jgi:Mrp family chromosome partitioning ATPase/capsular polysaccharide biosynthesis protein
MPANSSHPLSPSVIGALSRFRRVVIASVAFFMLAFALYSVVSGPTYAGKAAIVITLPPASLHPFASSGNSGTQASYVNRQIALIQSQTVSNGAAAIVNQKISTAHVSGQEINSNLTVKPQTGVSTGLSPTTNVTVTNGNPEVAAASANAVLASYIVASKAQIRNQANQSIAALNRQIATTQAKLNALPPLSTGKGGGSSGTTTTTIPAPVVVPHTTTTVVHPPRTTTTRAPRTTTTRPPRTTTTQPPRTTTTHATTTTSTTAAALSKVSGRVDLTDYSVAGASSQTQTHPSSAVLVATTATTATTAAGSTATTTTIAASGSSSSTSTSGTGSSAAASSNNAQRYALANSLLLLSKSKAQVNVNEQADLQYQNVVYLATIPTKPLNGSFWKELGLGFLLGLIVGVIAAYALAYARQVFEKEEEPELLYDVPMVAAVPAFRQPAWLPTGLPILTEPFDEPAEQFRNIATTLRSMRNSHLTMLTAFSAAAPRSGTTTVVANTGFALAAMGERVLVVDGDPVGRGLTRTLLETDLEHPMANPRTGFSEVLGGRPLLDTVVPAEANPNLFILGSGLDPDLALSRWSGQSIRLALADAQEHFDIVLVDVPPVGSSFGMDLSRACRNLMLVVPYLDPVRYHSRLKERLDLADISLLGYVFNGAPSSGEFVPYYPLLHSASVLPESELVPIASSSAAIGAFHTPDATSSAMSTRSATATAVKDPDGDPGPASRGTDDDVDAMWNRDDETGVVPAVRRVSEPSTQQVPAQREAAAQEPPAPSAHDDPTLTSQQGSHPASQPGPDPTPTSTPTQEVWLVDPNDAK